MKIIDPVKWDKFISLYTMTKTDLVNIGIHNFVELCKTVGISEQTGYKWQRKLKKEGIKKPFDIRKYMSDELESMARSLVQTVKDGKAPGNLSGAIRTLKELINDNSEQGKYELSVGDRIEIGKQFRNELKRECEDFGYCPICNQSLPLRGEARVAEEREHEQDREVAAVAVSE